MRSTTRLRQLLNGGSMVVAPFILNALHAKIAESVDFQAVYMTGSGTAAERGFPDVGLLTMTEMVTNAKYVADAVQANLKAARSSEANGAVVNVAVGERTTINELAAMVIKLVGAEVEPEHLEPRTGDIRHSLADISRAREVMGYEPGYSLEQGLWETVHFFKERL